MCILKPEGVGHMIFDKVKAIILEQFMADEDSITMQTSFIDDLEADSLDLIELVMAIEEEFGLSIEDQDVGDIKTVGDVVNYISERQ